MNLRWMQRRDLYEVMSILRQNGSNLTEEYLISLLRQRNCIGIVQERDEEIFGFIIYELHKTYFEIKVIYTLPDYTYEFLINKLIDKLSIHRRVSIKIEFNERYELANELKEYGFYFKGHKALYVLPNLQRCVRC